MFSEIIFANINQLTLLVQIFTIFGRKVSLLSHLLHDAKSSLERNEIKIVKVEAIRSKMRLSGLLYDLLSQSYNSLNCRSFFIVVGSVMLLAVTQFPSNFHNFQRSLLVIKAFDCARQIIWKKDRDERRRKINRGCRFALQWRVLPDEDGHRYTLQVQQHRRFSGGLQKGLPQSHRGTLLQEGTYLSVHKGPTTSERL